MNHFNLSASIIFSTGLLFSCAACHSAGTGANAADANTSISASKTASSDLALTGSAGAFSYTINGQRVETVNNVQNANLFINEVRNDAATGMMKIEVTCSARDVFHFDIANSGTSYINNRQPPSIGSTSIKTKAASYMDGKTARNLYAVSVTVTITKIDENRVSGTFSGTFKADESDGGATANITNGSFNLPFIKN